MLLMIYHGFVLLFLSFLLVPPSFGFNAELQVKEFSDAQKAEQYLRFDMETKKLGLFNKHLVGFVREFKASGKIANDLIETGEVSFKVRSIDTDLFARDDQLWNFCLGMKEHPEIQIRIRNVKLLPGKETDTIAEVHLRGESRSAPLKLSRAGPWIEGKGLWSLKDLGIPDPSIGIASVQDNFSVSFKIKDR
jgi:polyisoprenoid-binding protein YceI